MWRDEDSKKWGALYRVLTFAQYDTVRVTMFNNITIAIGSQVFNIITISSNVLKYHFYCR